MRVSLRKKFLKNLARETSIELEATLSTLRQKLNHPELLSSSNFVLA